MSTNAKSWVAVFAFWVLIFGAWIVGVSYSMHFRYWWFDVIMHFVGGIWVLALVLTLKHQYRIEISGKKSALAAFVILVGLVVLVGVFWEFLEFITDRYILKTGFTHMRGVYVDTLGDLFMDTVGGTFGSLIYLLNNKKKNA